MSWTAERITMRTALGFLMISNGALFLFGAVQHAGSLLGSHLWHHASSGNPNPALCAWSSHLAAPFCHCDDCFRLNRVPVLLCRVRACRGCMGYFDNWYLLAKLRQSAAASSSSTGMMLAATTGACGSTEDYPETRVMMQAPVIVLNGSPSRGCGRARGHDYIRADGLSQRDTLGPKKARRKWF